MSDGPTMSMDEAIRGQRALRDALGLGPERFPIPAFVGMVSDEIEKLRDAGTSDAAIADLVERAIGLKIPAEDIATHYAPPDRRAHG